MNAEIANLRDTIVPKSDQLNSEQLLGTSLTIEVTAVRRSTSDDQPIAIHYKDDNGRPYKPCKTMRKLIIMAWGDDGNQWIGKSMKLYNDPEVKWGGVKVGGIRISHMSHIESDIAASLAVTKGKKAAFVVKRLTVKKLAAAPATAPDPKPQHLIDDAHDLLRIAASKGPGELVNQWKTLSADMRKELGGACPQIYKDAAAAADAAKTEQDEF